MIEKMRLEPHGIEPGDAANQLKKLLPEAVRDGKIDFDLLRELLGDELLDEDEKAEPWGLNWPGKRDARKMAMTPSRLTLKPLPGEGINEDNAQHVLIEGDNLEVLKILRKSYFGQVKMIYIDPPYNTGNDFVYKDDFSENRQEYIDNAGLRLHSNRRDDGRFHANWLSFMYPRLRLAKQLLRDDGVIFISIDDNEVHNLRGVMNEIFGEENFRNCIVVKRGIKNVQSQFEEVQSLTVGHEYLLCYSRSSNRKLPKLDKSHDSQKAGKWDTFWRGTDRATMRYELFEQKPETGQWRWEEERTKRAIENYKQFLTEQTDLSLDDHYLYHLTSTNEKLDFVRLAESGTIQYYVTPKDTKLLSDNWLDLTLGNSYPNFDNAKNPQVIARMIEWIADKNDIILDFFAGSGTTGQAVMELNAEDGGNRKFVLVQIAEPTDPASAAFVAGYHTISDITKARIRKVIERMQAAPEASGQPGIFEGESQAAKPEMPGFRVYRWQPSNFREWQEPADKSAAQIQISFDQAAGSRLAAGFAKEDIITEIMLQKGFPLHLPVVRQAAFTENEVWETVRDDKSGLLVCLDEIVSPATANLLTSFRDHLFICRDEAVTDQVKLVFGNAGSIETI